MYKNFKLIFILLICIFILCGCGKRQEASFTESFFAMDTYMTFTVYGKGGRDALEAARAEIEELESLWSVTDEDSDIYALNQSGGKTVEVDEKTAELLSFALKMAAETDGALEPTVYPVLLAWGFTTEEYRIPDRETIERLLKNVDYEKVVRSGSQVHMEPGMMLDLGSVGKGYAGDLLARLLKEKGVESALLDIGGNIQTVGNKPDGSLWRLGLRDPFSEGMFGTIAVGECAAVTSGAYERFFIGEDGKRYGHILNPATGYPAESGLASVTVIAEEGRLCDALSTALYVMGAEKAAAYWKTHGDFDMILVTDNKEIYLTEKIASCFVPAESCQNWKIHVISQQ